MTPRHFRRPSPRSMRVPTAVVSAPLHCRNAAGRGDPRRPRQRRRRRAGQRRNSRDSRVFAAADTRARPVVARARAARHRRYRARHPRSLAGGRAAFCALARDMAMSHEWLFPRVGGDLYQDKPPLFFWLLAICYSLFGSVKAWFLIPSFLAAGGILFLLYDFGRRAVSPGAGLCASLITACTLQFFMVTRGAQIDATLCFLTTLVAVRIAPPSAARTRVGLVFHRWFCRGSWNLHQGRRLPADIAADSLLLATGCAVAGIALRQCRWRRLALVARAARDDSCRVIVVRSDAHRRGVERLGRLCRLSR